MTEKELVAKMIGTLAKGRKEIDNSDYKITIEALPELDEIIEHLSSPLMIMVMGEFSTGKSTFINALVGEEIAVVNATPTTAVITKLCYGEQDKILVHFTDGTEKEVESNTFKQLTSKTGKVDEDNVHESIEYVERQMPLDMLQYVTIIDSPGLNDVNEKHSATTKKFVSNADSVLWMFSALHAGSKTEIDAVEALTPRLKPIAIINMMDELDEEEDNPQEFLDNLRVQLKDKVQAVVGISAKYALEGKLEKNETKTDIGNLKELEKVVQELVLPNRDKFKLNTLMDELGEWIYKVANDLTKEEVINQNLKESDYSKYLEDKAYLQKNKEVLVNITAILTDYCGVESKKYNEQAMFFMGILYYYGISFEKNDNKAEYFLENAALKNHILAQSALGTLYAGKDDFKKAFMWWHKVAEQGLAEQQYLVAISFLNGMGIEKNETKAFKWLKKAAQQDNENAEVLLGQCYEKGWGTKKNNEKAIECYKKMAEQGNAKAQFYLGQCYENGLGTKINTDKAIYWYKKAAEQGNEEAQCFLGGYYYNEFDYIEGLEDNNKQAFYWYKKAAEQGNARAQFYLGQCYEKGLGTEIDTDKAIYWYTKAAEQGDVETLKCLGDCYCNAGGKKQDFRQAAYWYKKAAEQGVVDLGDCYSKIAYEDDQNAVYWYKKAAEQGNVKALERIGDCYCDAEGVEQDFQQAAYWYKKAAEQGVVDLADCYSKIAYKDDQNNVYWYTKAAEQGDVVAQTLLGFFYFKGDGVQQDYQQAIYWHTKAAEQGNAAAQNCLGLCYQQGKGVQQDWEQAIYWYTKAAEQGNAVAQDNLGYTFCKKQDFQQAKYWYTKAADQGDEVAKRMLVKLNEREHLMKTKEAAQGSGCLIPMIVFICIIGALCLL